MSRTLLNRILNTCLFFCGLGLVLTGTLQAWILPRGSAGRGLAWLGLSRHEWGDVHEGFALAACVGVLLHLALHWDWLKAFLLGATPRRPAGWALMGLAGGLMVAAVALPFLLETGSAAVGQGLGEGLGQGLGGGWHGGR